MRRHEDDKIGYIILGLFLTFSSGALLIASIAVLVGGDIPNPRVFLSSLIGFPLFLWFTIRMIVSRIKSIPADLAYPGKLKAAPALADSLLAGGESLATVQRELARQGIASDDIRETLFAVRLPEPRCPSCTHMVQELTNLARATVRRWWTCPHCDWVRDRVPGGGVNRGP